MKAVNDTKTTTSIYIRDDWFCSFLKSESTGPWLVSWQQLYTSTRHSGGGKRRIGENPWFREHALLLWERYHPWSSDQEMRTKQSDGESFSASLLS